MSYSDPPLERPAGDPRVTIRRLTQSPSATVGLVLLALILYGSLKLQGDFLAVSNATTVGDSMLAPLLIGLVVSVALLGGVVDLSIGYNVGVSAGIFGLVFNNTGSVPLSVCATLGFGLCVGLVNAVTVVWIGANDIVATLAMLATLQGVLILLHEDATIEFAFVPSFYDALSARLFGFPLFLYPVVAGFILAELALRWTRPGQHLRAIGGNARAARRAGIKVAFRRAFLFVAVSLSCSIGALVYVGQTGSAPATLGAGPFVLQVLGGALIGGFSIMHGGVGSPIGAMFGIFTLFLLTNLLDLSSAAFYWQSVVLGALIVVAAYIDGLRGGERFE